MAAGSSSSSAAAPPQKAHYSGLWLGEAHPDPSFSDVPVNPIKWALSLCPDPSGGAISAFGAGYFDDAGDIPGQPVLFYTLQGTFDQAAKKVTLTKIYSSRVVPEELQVVYVGALADGPDGQPTLSGTWANAMEGTRGVFACRLEE
eukprot:CAMPEP_0206232296 /NCGR_PEP_ID=MMETSP0047_2-20121206/11336_1 /ASSEMBLY_ACC=CAM_ASM_000192 /TAXON_ID=195065 /ORGANISM="Chroomonas mesostigmatica_cf, Strain CCMP1168" /LENGTH=145 /DNA_ID=CAMNT_0053656015 /DNA_START=98 /DNA_END=535 /DNA_ORIENTATION=+